MENFEISREETTYLFVLRYFMTTILLRNLINPMRILSNFSLGMILKLENLLETQI